jgi:hypothetical protein
MQEREQPAQSAEEWFAGLCDTLARISVPKAEVEAVVTGFEELRRIALALDAVDRGMLQRGGMDTSLLDATKLEFENTITALVGMVRADRFNAELERTLHDSSEHAGAGTELAWWSLEGLFPSAPRSRELALYLASRVVRDPASVSLLRSPRASIRAVHVNLLVHTPMWVYAEIAAAVEENKIRLHRPIALSVAHTGLDPVAGEYLASLWSSKRTNRYNDLDLAVRAALALSRGSRQISVR